MNSITVCAAIRRLFLSALVALAACGPQIGGLEKGETGKVARVFDGDTLVLESGMRVFLAEIDAPQGDDDYGAQAHAELEALTLHRTVLLAYGGAKRWTPRGRPDDERPPPETAIAHVYVRSEGGRWFWLQHALVSRGAAFVRARRDNHARSEDLLAVEARAREARRGLWEHRTWRTLNASSAAHEALEAPTNCTWNGARYRIVEGKVGEVYLTQGRASLEMERAADEPRFWVVVFGASFSAWDGPALASLRGTRIRVRGPLGVFRDEPQLCLEDSRQLEVLDAG